MPDVKLRNMDITALLALRADIDRTLSSKKAELQRQLEAISGPSPSRSNGRVGRRKTLKGRKVPAQFRSRKNSKLTWAGRGATPRWMRDEMKGTKLKKEDFRIK